MKCGCSKEMELVNEITIGNRIKLFFECECGNKYTYFKKGVAQVSKKKYKKDYEL